MALPLSNVVDFGKVQEQNKYRTQELRSLNNFAWFFKFELGYLKENGQEVPEDHYCHKELDLIYKELKRRVHLGDKEAQEVLENWWS